MTDAEKLDFYRDAYEKSHARAEALEKSNDRLYEREAEHTEAYGMVCAERDRYKAEKAALWELLYDVRPFVAEHLPIKGRIENALLGKQPRQTLPPGNGAGVAPRPFPCTGCLTRHTCVDKGCAVDGYLGAGPDHPGAVLQSGAVEPNEEQQGNNQGDSA